MQSRGSRAARDGRLHTHAPTALPPLPVAGDKGNNYYVIKEGTCDVMVTDDNLFGDAVNIAARLEAEAQPAGICVSQTVFDMIGQKIMVSFEDAGRLELKNIENPVQAYFVIKGQGGVRYLQQAETPQVAVNEAESGSLAVMLFKSLSKDEEQAYFCEGFSEDLIASLSRFRSLTVVSGNASFSYRDKQMGPMLTIPTRCRSIG